MIWPREPYLLPIVFFSRATPRFWQLIQTRVVSLVLYRVWKEKRDVLKSNLSVVLGRDPEDRVVKESARDTWFNYGLYSLDYVSLNTLNKKRGHYLIPEQHQTHYVQEALDRGRGGILITPHLGNWELGGATFALRGCPIYALTLKNPEARVQNFRDRMRATLGMRSIHIDPSGSGYQTTLKLAQLLRKNKFIAMLGDRWEGGKKAEVEFFGKKVIFPAGASALALATSAPIIPVFTVVRPGGTYMAWAEAPIYVTRSRGQTSAGIVLERTQEVARVFENAIAAYPTQWYHFFDYWKRYAC